MLRAWFVDPDTAMSPNLKYGGFVPGVNGGLGKPSGIIVTTCRWTTKVTDSAALIAGSAHWTAQDQTAFNAWNRAYLDWLLGPSPIAMGEFRATNNHFTWLEVEALALALSTGNSSAAAMLAARATSAAVPGCLQKQIDQQGLMKLEASREAGATYSTMNLRALFSLATVVSGHVSGAEPLWAWKDGEGRGSIKAALDYLLPFAINEKPWPWKQDGSATPWAKMPWTSLAPQLRISGLVYGDPKYEAAIAKLPWTRDGAWQADVTQLLWPLPSALTAGGAGESREMPPLKIDEGGSPPGIGCAAGVGNVSLRRPCAAWRPSWGANESTLCVAHDCCWSPTKVKGAGWCFASSSLPTITNKQLQHLGFFGQPAFNQDSYRPDAQHAFASFGASGNLTTLRRGAELGMLPWTCILTRT